MSETRIVKASEVILDQWQQEVLEAKGNVLLCKGRQIGGTTIFAIKAAKRMVNQEGCQIVIASLTEDQAKNIVAMILDYLEKNYKKLIAEKKDAPTQKEIKLKNGSCVKVRPVGDTGDSIRSFTGDVLYLDETARMRQNVFDAGKAVLLTTAGDIWMSSTPHGKQGYFWDAFQNKNGRFKVFHINSEQVINERPVSASWTQEKRDAAIRFLQDEKKDMSQLQYGQEYLGLFLEELCQYFSDELIAKCCILKREGKYKNENYMGVDLARLGGDDITYEILHKFSADKIIQIENITKKMQLTTQTEADILALNKMFNTGRIGIDAGAGSLGVGIFDRLMQNAETKSRVVPMNNREILMDKEGKKKQTIFKEDMYENLLNLMEKGAIKLLDDDEIALSLKSVQWELDEKNSISKVRITGKNNHIVEGLVRAAWLAQKQKINKLWIACI